MVASRCCICGRLLDENKYESTPYKKGMCCPVCNHKYILPARENYMMKKKKY